jgi:hypothetical protein
MNIPDTKESLPLVDRVLIGLLNLVPMRGKAGLDARRLIGDTRANLETLLRNDAVGPALDQCFDLTRAGGVYQKWFAELRRQIGLEKPVTIGAMLMKNGCIYLCLAMEVQIITDMNFTSRQDVDAIKKIVAVGFNDAEEIAADDMDQMTYRALIEAHSALTFYLTETARPLPRMLNFRFGVAMPSLVMAYKLYQDAGRADELRLENKVVHPAFTPPTGMALSA